MYIEEARKKSELFFDTEMQRAYDEGMEKAKVEAEVIVARRPEMKKKKK